jgi:eukaryotic-like serine/threonine-protein kinase
VSSGRGSGGQRILAGRYRLDEVIGRGGMSTVYRGTDLALDRTVAVKVALDPLAEENPVYVARFKREARAAAALSDPGVVTVYDAGADGPTRYIVMEYVEGQNLSELLREQEPAHRLDPARAARIAEEVAGTLAVAHAAGIVHRDIKPGNIMVGPGDRVKVLDFGIARISEGVSLTQTASVLGTAPYMAPEQAMGNPADARSDIYSLGCVLYEMLTGKPPFMADVPAAVLHQQVRVQPKPPRERNPDVPPALNALVLEMLAKNPDDRPQTASEVHDRLAAFLSGTQTEPTRAMPAAAPAVEAIAAAATVPQAATVRQPATAPREAAPPPRGTAATTALPPPARPSPRRGLYGLLAVIALLLLGGAVAYALAGGGSSHSTSTPSHSAATTTVTQTSGQTPTTSSTPSTSASTSTPTTTTTKTVTATSTPSTTTPPATTTGPATPTAQGGTPPGQGATPPGQAKKTKTK